MRLQLFQPSLWSGKYLTEVDIGLGTKGGRTTGRSKGKMRNNTTSSRRNVPSPLDKRSFFDRKEN